MILTESLHGLRSSSWSRRWRQILSQWLDRQAMSESAIIMLTALVVGIGAGLGAVIFRRLIAGAQTLAYDGLGGILQTIAPFRLLIIPALGGAIFGPLIYRFAREVKGHGVPDETMWKALKRLGMRDVSRLPVLQDEGSRRLVGVIRRQDIVRAYNRAIIKRAHHQHRAETLRLGKLDGAGFTHIRLPPGAPGAGRRVSEIGLPDDCLVVSVRRGRKLHIAHGNTQLQPEDLVTVFAADECLPEVERRLTGEPSQGELHGL